MRNVQRLATKAVHAGERHGRPTSMHYTCTTPIVTSSTFTWSENRGLQPSHAASVMHCFRVWCFIGELHCLGALALLLDDPKQPPTLVQQAIQPS